MRENERKGKRAGTAERFLPINFIHQQKGLVTVSCLGFFYRQNPVQNYQNNKSKHYYNRGKMGRNPKSDKKKVKK